MSFPCRVENGPHFETRTRPELDITSRNLARARHLFFEAQFKPESQIYRVRQDKRNCGVSKNVVHWCNCKYTALSHLDQNTGLNQGFSNYGSRPHLGSQNVILGREKVGLRMQIHRFL